MTTTEDDREGRRVPTRWEKDRWSEAEQRAREREAGRTPGPGWLDADEYQAQARAEVMERPDPRMQEVDRLYHTDRTRYDALPTELRLSYGLWLSMRGEQ